MVKRKKISFFKKVAIVLLFMFIGGIGLAAYNLYQAVYTPNVFLGVQQTTYIYIPTNADFDDVLKILVKNNLLLRRASFEWLAERMGYPANIHP